MNSSYVIALPSRLEEHKDQILESLSKQAAAHEIKFEQSAEFGPLELKSGPDFGFTIQRSSAERPVPSSANVSAVSRTLMHLQEKLDKAAGRR